MNCSPSVVAFARFVVALCAYTHGGAWSYCEHPTARMCVGVFMHADADPREGPTVLVRPAPAIVRELIESEGAPVFATFRLFSAQLEAGDLESGADLVYADGERYCQLQWGARPCRVSPLYN